MDNDNKENPVAPPAPATRNVNDSVKPGVQAIAKITRSIPDHVVVYLVLFLCIPAAWFISAIHTADIAQEQYRLRVDGVKKAYNVAAQQQRDESDQALAAIGKELKAARTRKEVVIKTIVKEVPKYVTTQADANCTIPAGFVWVHDASLVGEGPGVPASRPDDVDAPSGLALSAVAETVTSNNAECVERGKVISAWQRWYVEQKAIYERAQRIIDGAVVSYKK